MLILLILLILLIQYTVTLTDTWRFFSMLTTVSSYAEDRDNDEQIWNDLYTWLLSLVEKWVAYAHVTCWYGQQKEVSEDIAQEAILRVLRYRPVSYTHLRAHETRHDLVCRLLLEK